MMRLRGLFWAMLMLAAGMLSAQRSPFSVGLQAGVSYSGWNLALVGEYHLQSFSAYLGPSMSLNRGLPGRGPVGLCSGLDYHLPSTKDWLGSLVNLDYQLHFFSAAGAPYTQIHETHLSYGLEFHITPAIFVVQQLGVGAYWERNPVEEGSRKTLSGYNGLVRLKAGYRF